MVAALVLFGAAAACGGPATGGTAAHGAAAGAAAAGSGGGNGSGYGSSYGYGSGPSAGVGTAATQASAHRAGLAAATAYRTATGTALSGLAADLDALAAALAAGNVPSARSAELAAQGSFDGLRFLMAQGSTGSAALDGLPADLPPGTHLAGLHLVERDLWGGGAAGPSAAALATAAAAVGTLQAALPVAQVTLSRRWPGPRTITQMAVDELTWLNQVVVTGQAEPYSGRDAVDAVASVASAQADFSLVQPVGALVAPGPTAAAGAGLPVLARLVAALGPPATSDYPTVPVGTWRAVAQQADAVAAALADLAPSLAAYGTGRTRVDGTGHAGVYRP